MLPKASPVPARVRPYHHGRKALHLSAPSLPTALYPSLHFLLSLWLGLQQATATTGQRLFKANHTNLHQLQRKRKANSSQLASLRELHMGRRLDQLASLTSTVQCPLTLTCLCLCPPPPPERVGHVIGSKPAPLPPGRACLKATPPRPPHPTSPYVAKLYSPFFYFPLPSTTAFVACPMPPPLKPLYAAPSHVRITNPHSSALPSMTRTQ